MAQDCNILRFCLHKTAKNRTQMCQVWATNLQNSSILEHKKGSIRVGIHVYDCLSVQTTLTGSWETSVHVHGMFAWVSTSDIVCGVLPRCVWAVLSIVDGMGLD